MIASGQGDIGAFGAGRLFRVAAITAAILGRLGSAPCIHGIATAGVGLGSLIIKRARGSSRKRNTGARDLLFNAAARG